MRKTRLAVEHGRSRSLTPFIALGLGGVLLGATSCVLLGPSIPSRVNTPDLVGPIEDIRAVPGDEFARDVVVRGELIRVRPDQPRQLGSELVRDALFIYGEEASDSWHLILNRTATGELAGCYTFGSAEVFDDGSHLIFSVGQDEGIRLPKAGDLELPAPDPETGVYLPGSMHNYCIEADGTVSASDLPGSNPRPS